MPYVSPFVPPKLCDQSSQKTREIKATVLALERFKSMSSISSCVSCPRSPFRGFKKPRAAIVVNIQMRHSFEWIPIMVTILKVYGLRAVDVFLVTVGVPLCFAPPSRLHQIPSRSSSPRCLTRRSRPGSDASSRCRSQ